MTTKKTIRKDRKATSDAMAILRRRYVTGRPKAEAGLAVARLNAAIAQKIYDLRTKAGLTQKQLATLVGTSHSVVSRLEDADYEGHSLSMLQRISSALNYQIQVRFVPLEDRRKVSG